MKKILIVDDDRVNLIIAKRLLGKEYEPVTVDSGAKALDYLKDNHVDLVLLDIQMPGMDGFEVMGKLKQDENTVNTPVIFLTADHREETESKCFELGAVDFISKPFVPVIMQHRVRRTIELEDYRLHLERRLFEQLQKVTQLQDNMIITLANMIESRDGTTGEHVKRTSEFTRFLIEKLLEQGIYTEELGTETADLICKAAPMHDIGKITVEDGILRKPGRLTPEEFDAMKRHSTAGSEIIRANMSTLAEGDFVETAYNLARYHHERWDGKGYPDGLSGTQIPLCARILAVADVYDALTARRSYKEPMSTEQALEIMQNNEGQFEPLLLQIFAGAKEELKALTARMYEGKDRAV